MKIVIYIGGLSGGGAERVVCNLANYLSSRHDVEILTMSDDNPTYKLEHVIRRRVLINKNERRFFLYNSLLRFVRLCRFLIKEKPDVYIVMLPITTILLLSLSFLTKSKIIAAERSYPLIYKGYIRKLLAYTSRYADGWVFQNETQLEWYSKCKLKKRRIISNAINPDFSIDLYNGERKKVIVTVGSLSVPKNHELLIEAFYRVSCIYPDYSLVIYGKGSKLEKLQDLTKQLGIHNKVSFPGYTQSVGETIKDSAFFVLSSNYEGLPNALMEAMALGLPCISTDCDGGGAKALIENEVNGLLVAKGDIDGLANAMIRLIENKEFAYSLGQNASLIKQTNSPKKIYGEWELFINSVIGCG